MMVKVEEDTAPELLPEAETDAEEYSSGGEEDDDDEEEEETDSEGDGAGGGGAPPLKKGPWTPEEDKRLKDYVEAHGEGNWNKVQRNAGLNRCGKSCRLRWANHLRPDLKKGPFDHQEVEKIIQLHMIWGNKWAKMAACLPGRTDNEIKNYWNTRLKRHRRASLPIYPEHLVSRVSNQDMNCYTPEESCSKKQSNDVPHEDILDLNDLMTFDHIDYRNYFHDLPGPNPVIPFNPLKRRSSTGCIASDYNGSLTCVQIPDEPEKTGCSTDFNYGMTGSQLAPPGSAIVGDHPIFYGNPSTSGTIQRSMKMELPSFQCPNYGCDDWLYACPSGSPIEQADTFVESPGSVSVKSESISSQNTGLDAIVHKGDGLDNPTKPQGVFEVSVPPLAYNQVLQSNAYPMRHSSSYFLGDCELEGCPFGEIQASKSASSSDAIFVVSKYYRDTRLSDKYPPSWPDAGMPDASLEASLFNEGCICSKDPSIMQTLDSIFDEDSHKEANLSTAGHGFDAAWESMPDASYMPDFPHQ